MNRVLLKKENIPPEWMVAQEKARKQSIIIFRVGGMFIGVAYYPWIFYLTGLAVCLDNVYHIEDPMKA